MHLVILLLCIVQLPVYNTNNFNTALFSSAIKWNFTKFVVDRNGELKVRFGPNVDPLVSIISHFSELVMIQNIIHVLLQAKECVSAIEDLLK